MPPSVDLIICDTAANLPTQCISSQYPAASGLSAVFLGVLPPVWDCYLGGSSSKCIECFLLA